MNATEREYEFMKTYRLTDEEHKELLNASNPVPYMVFGGHEPESPVEKTIRLWNEVAKKNNCKVGTIEDAGTGDSHDFRAEPNETIMPL